MRTPFDSALELDDLLEESRAYALRYGRPGSVANLAARARFRQRIKTSEDLVRWRIAVAAKRERERVEGDLTDTPNPR